jgi:hypothetical protein
MADMALNSSAQLIYQSKEKLSESAASIAAGNINPAEIARIHTEAVRETELGVKIAHVSQDMSDELMEMNSETRERKGRALDHFS